jgi:hypothetical protein
MIAIILMYVLLEGREIPPAHDGAPQSLPFDLHQRAVAGRA